VTRKRIYLETMERVLGGTDKTIIDTGGQSSPGVVPYLPLTSLPRERATQHYSTRGPTLSKWLTQVAPAASDPVMQSYAQDRFYNTELDKILKDKGITTLILTGWKVSGSVTSYTSVGRPRAGRCRHRPSRQ
jgi:hypothetical protein